MVDVRLGGCRPEPLGRYLKALGVFRLVAEQADADARGWWQADEFWLRSALGAEDLVTFFAERWRPTPILSPWNGGSGFYPKDNQEGIGPIEKSKHERFAPYRDGIRAGRSVISEMGLEEKPDAELKPRLVEALRAEVGEQELSWIDAAIAIDGASSLLYPPLLGTGGNDGRLDFSNNQMQRLANLLLGPGVDLMALRESLLGGAAPTRASGWAIGQFNPAGAGGANAGPGLDGPSVGNLWDFVLMLEGALLLTGAVTRRLESRAPAALAFPFTVRAAGAGYPTAAISDEAESRDEMWLPLWSAPASLGELRVLMREGRGRVSVRRGGRFASRNASSGVDFARAARSLGVDRGIAEFTRFGFHVRNGLSYLATPLGRWKVTRRARPDLLGPIDDWLVSFQRAARTKNAPASIRRAAARLEAAILEYCATGEATNVLVTLGDAERSLGRSYLFARDAYVRPVPSLAVASWLPAVDDKTPEFRLAAALASVGTLGPVGRGDAGVVSTRQRLSPVGSGGWTKGQDDRSMWSEAPLETNLCRLLLRQDVERSQGGELAGSNRTVLLADVAEFIDARTDDARLEQLLCGLALLDWRGENHERASGDVLPPAAYSLLALAWNGKLEPDVVLHRTPGLVNRAVAGDMVRASRLAIRRLRSAGLAFPLSALHEPPRRTRRIAAALTFPVSHAGLVRLRESLFPLPNVNPSQSESTS